MGIAIAKSHLHDLPGYKYSYDNSTSVCMSSSPLFRDPYEQQTCYISRSGIHPNAGEGLFAKRYLPKGCLVAIFNGIRRREIDGVKEIDMISAYKIGLTRGMDLDIPDWAISAKKYCATLGHKCCHSFTPNAE